MECPTDTVSERRVLLKFHVCIVGSLPLLSLTRARSLKVVFVTALPNIQGGAAYRSQGFEDKNLGSSSGLFGQ